MERGAPPVARDDPRPAPAPAPPAARGVGWLRPAWVARAGYALAGLVLFALALEVVRAGAGSLAPLLSDIGAEGVANGLGFGWLFAYVVLSGSPVAAIGVTLLSEGVFHETEAFAVIAGSRLGASFVVLAAGFLAFRFGRRSGDGIAIGPSSTPSTRPCPACSCSRLGRPCSSLPSPFSSVPCPSLKARPRLSAAASTCSTAAP